MFETTAEPVTAEEVVRSAEIIPFRPRAVPLVAAPTVAPAADLSPAQERLARALEMLNAAMADQRSAMAQWRTSLAALKNSTTGLGVSLSRYQANLTSLGHSVSALRTQARSLQSWADKATLPE